MGNMMMDETRRAMRLHGIEAKTLTKEFLERQIDRFLQIERAWIALGETPWTTEHYLQERPLKWRLSSYVHHESDIIGYAIVSKTAPQTAYLHNLLVDLDHQGRGAGFLLFTESLARSKREGLEEMAFKSRVDNERANNLYVSFGARKAGREVSPDGVERYLFSLELQGKR